MAYWHRREGDGQTISSVHNSGNRYPTSIVARARTHAHARGGEGGRGGVSNQTPPDQAGHVAIPVPYQGANRRVKSRNGSQLDARTARPYKTLESSSEMHLDVPLLNPVNMIQTYYCVASPPPVVGRLCVRARVNPILRSSRLQGADTSCLYPRTHGTSKHGKGCCRVRWCFPLYVVPETSISPYLLEVVATGLRSRRVAGEIGSELCPCAEKY